MTQKETRRRRKSSLIALMGGCCQVCGYDRCVDALDFHHINPNEKDSRVSPAMEKSLRSGGSQLYEELKKCILVCCRCHREIHYGKAILPKTYSIVNQSQINKFIEDDKGFLRGKRTPENPNKKKTCLCGAKKHQHPNNAQVATTKVALSTMLDQSSGPLRPS